MKTSITRIGFGVAAAKLLAAGIADVRGWYCPGDGRIHFVHTNATTDVPVRMFDGYLSDDVAGQSYMAGTFSVLVSAFGDFGEYPFYAFR